MALIDGTPKTELTITYVAPDDGLDRYGTWHPVIVRDGETFLTTSMPAVGADWDQVAEWIDEHGVNALSIKDAPKGIERAAFGAITLATDALMASK